MTIAEGLAAERLPERWEVDGLVFDVVPRPARATLEITVERDASLSLKVPDRATTGQVEAFVSAKRAWIFRKLAEKDALFHPPVVKQLIDGEGFAYLGRGHRLLLVDRQDVPAKLQRGRLRVRRADARTDGVAVIRRWYQATGSSWLTRRVQPWAARLGANDITVDVAGLGYRWGSVGKGNRVNIHWATLQLPPTLIDYVLVHELAHLEETNHTPRFWQLVGRVLPDFDRRKDALAHQGAELWLGDVVNSRTKRA
jgi:predicted metal-dependent hydrolase